MDMTASAALGNLPEWNLADLYAAPDAAAFKADMLKGEAEAKAMRPFQICLAAPAPMPSCIM